MAQPEQCQSPGVRRVAHRQHVLGPDGENTSDVADRRANHNKMREAMKRLRSLVLVLATLFGVVQWGVAANDVSTQFPDLPGIINTRHNMSQSTEMSNQTGGPNTGGGTMNAFRNRYGEVCVYCHTPHGASTAAAVPLWNRSLPTTTTYVTYDQLNTSSLTQTVFQPGAASLPCLSCHDGTQAIDAIINMPGSGQYFSTPNPAAWNPVANGYPAGFRSAQHRTLVGCMACHAADGGPGGVGTDVATDFGAFYIGTDLRNDHPVGVTFPATNGAGTDWKTPGGTKVVNGLTNKFFDDNNNNRMDKSDIRLYDSGNGPSVECASCHDPHGVPSTVGGRYYLPTFLRKTNTASAVCQTCHSK
jgi:putative hemolysin